MLKLNKISGSPYWYATGTHKTPQGKSTIYRESTKCVKRKDAEIWFENFKRHLDAIESNVVDITFYEASVSYANSKDSIHPEDASRIEVINEYFESTPLSKINSDLWNDFCSTNLKGRVPETCNRYRSNMRAILNHAKSNTPHQHINNIPAKKIDPSPPRYLSLEDQERMINGYCLLLKPLITTLCFQGCRVGEALRLQWSDIDLDNRRINIWKTKNGHFRSLPMHKRVFEILRGINRERTGHIFVTPSGEPYAYIDKPNGSPIKTAHRTALKQTGITNFKVHNWRSHWASNMALKGANTYELMALGGWRSASSVSRYVQLNPDSLSDAINRLD